MSETIQDHIARLFLAPDEGGMVSPVMRNPHLHCPYCGFDHVHLKKPMYFPGNDGYEASKVFALGVRGDVLVLSFWGECGHSWGLAFGEHKGQIVYALAPDNRGEQG